MNLLRGRGKSEAATIVTALMLLDTRNISSGFYKFLTLKRYRKKFKLGAYAVSERYCLAGLTSD